MAYFRVSKQESNWEGKVESKHDLVYLTDAYPIYFARGATDEGDQLLILKVNVNTRNIYPDEDFIARYLQYAHYPEMTLQDLNPLVDPKEFKQLAKNSLEFNGVCAVKKVTPQNILDYRTFDYKNDLRLILQTGGDTTPIPDAYKVMGDMYRTSTNMLFEKSKEEVLHFVQNYWFIKFPQFAHLAAKGY